MRRCTFWLTRSSQCNNPAFLLIGASLAFCHGHEPDLSAVPASTKASMGMREVG